MKKDTAYALIISILLIATVIFIIKSTKSTIKEELRDFAIEDTSAVTKIFLVDKQEKQVILEKKDGLWWVNNKFEARKDAINTLLKTMHRIAIKQPVSNSAKNTAIRNLSTSSIKVEIYTNNDKADKIYYVGGPTQDQQGTFMIIEDSSTPFITHIPGFSGYLTTRYFTDEILWRNQEFFKTHFEDLKKIKIYNHMNSEKSFSIENEKNNSYKLLNSEGNSIPEFDTVQLKFYMAHFKKLVFETIDIKMDKNIRDSILKTEPLYSFDIKTFTNKNIKFKTYKKPIDEPYELNGEIIDFDVDRLYLKLESDSNLAKIQYIYFDPLFKDIDYFFKVNN